MSEPKSYLTTTNKPTAHVRMDNDTAQALAAHRANLQKLTGVDVSISKSINSLLNLALTAKGLLK